MRRNRRDERVETSPPALSGWRGSKRVPRPKLPRPSPFPRGGSGMPPGLGRGSSARRADGERSEPDKNSHLTRERPRAACRRIGGVKEKHHIYERSGRALAACAPIRDGPMRIVYHANYIVWFEIGRTEFCRAAGFPYREMEEQGVLILVTGVDCRYGRSASYDDEVTIRTRMGDVGSRGLSFFYEIVRGDDGTPLAEGSTRHAFRRRDGKADSHSGRDPCRLRDSSARLRDRPALRFPELVPSGRPRLLRAARPAASRGSTPGDPENAARSAFATPGGVSADTSPPSRATSLTRRDDTYEYSSLAIRKTVSTRAPGGDSSGPSETRIRNRTSPAGRARSCAPALCANATRSPENSRTSTRAPFPVTRRSRR